MRMLIFRSFPKTLRRLGNSLAIVLAFLAAEACAQDSYNDAVVGYARVGGPGTPTETFSYNRSGGAIEVTNPQTGRYNVVFEGAAAGLVGDAHPQVTATGIATVASGPNVTLTFCSIGNWLADTNDLIVAVFCNNVNGPRNSSFMILVLDGGNVVGSNANLAFAWSAEIEPAGGEADVTDLPTTHNPATTQNPADRRTIVRHTDVGRYFVEFGSLGGPDGNPQVTAAMGSARNVCGATGWEEGRAGVRCFGGDDFESANSLFNVLLSRDVAEAPGYAFAWNDISDAPDEYAELTNNETFNPFGTVEVRRVNSQTGLYDLRFNGITTGGPGGNIAVMPHIAQVDPQPVSCGIGSFFSAEGTAQRVRIRCFDLISNEPVDARFTVLSTFVNAVPVTADPIFADRFEQVP